LVGKLHNNCPVNLSSFTQRLNDDKHSIFFDELYKNFNERNIETVIAAMARNVKWANGMEGGYVYGHDGVRQYWKRQFMLVSSNVTPMKIETENESVRVKVHQVVHDLNGNLISDEVVGHLFRLKDGKVAEFDIVKS
jgi:SnoaL-like domain